MSIDSFRDHDAAGELPSTTMAQLHAHLALEQSAHFAARLAIARWINGSGADPVPAEPGARRALWLAEAHGHFQQWLSEGGFAGSELGDMPPLRHAHGVRRGIGGAQCPNTCLD